MMPGPPIVVVALAALSGLAAGWLHFRTLRLLSDHIAAGERRAIVLQLLRLCGMFGYLVLVAQFGAAALLSATLGVLLGRAWVMRAAKEGMR